MRTNNLRYAARGRRCSHPFVELLLCAAAFVDCGGSVATGASGTPCNPDGTCDPGLVCVSGTCGPPLLDASIPDTYVPPEASVPDADAGPLVCEGGTAMCAGECVDTDTSAANCGGCGKVCNGDCFGARCIVTLASIQAYRVVVNSTDAFFRA